MICYKQVYWIIIKMFYMLQKKKEGNDLLYGDDYETDYHANFGLNDPWVKKMFMYKL